MRWRFPFPVRAKRSLRGFPTDKQVVIFSTRPVLHRGYDPNSIKTAIADLQDILEEKELLANPSGEYDEATEAAVKKFQEKNSLFPDGIVGPFTWSALYYPQLSLQDKAVPELQPAIEKMQERLCKSGFPTQIDGCFGKKTEYALKRFQRSYGLYPDGVCNSMTWAVLIGQRQQPTMAGFFVARRQLVEQLLMVANIFVGIFLSPLSAESISFPVSLATAYGLTCIVPPVLERLQLKLLSFPLLQFSPYLLIGFLWHPVLDALKLLVTKFAASLS